MGCAGAPFLTAFFWFRFSATEVGLLDFEDVPVKLFAFCIAGKVCLAATPAVFVDVLALGLLSAVVAAGPCFADCVDWAGSR